MGLGCDPLVCPPPEAERNAWLWYAWEWVKQHDPNGFVELPGFAACADLVIDPVGNRQFLHANTPSPAFPQGFGQEETIKSIWAI